jgi:uncharacterized paraquat-inducible protein A
MQEGINIMTREIAQCPVCGQTITPEEVEVGMSLVCPRCATIVPHTKDVTRQQRAEQDKSKTKSPASDA